ncbi:MAG: hypothetical protein M1821_002749 [Bathelium mastoideum]|nr:MAG: hypothetical protein M1821_002749 [Bathelium mastoideum]KAI9683772.1 MAG: hypothetical protein M1822_005962 [Bathelium mastoideum]
MGKRGGKKFNRDRGGGHGGRDARGNNRTNAQELDRHNEKFERYYNTLELVSDNEREAFWDSLRRELPNSFRFAGSKGHALTVQQHLVDRYIPEITKVQFNGEYVAPPVPVPWFPERLAWSMTTPKNVVRKFPPFASFQKFLVSETSVGNISRQEIVSMIPPLLMDIKPGMTVLDLCAAPGSKAAQLLEMVHGGEEARVRNTLHRIAQQEGREMSPDGIEIEAEKDHVATGSDWPDDGRSTGLLIANDKDYRRAHLLVHQMKRLNSPNLVVMNHDATLFPSLKLPGANNTYLKFDRILADVPCSGDGTARKNVNIWKDWLPGNGLGLHPMQVRILVRALQMLKVGGRVVYSTCSMNPVENEAVVASAIDRCGGPSKVALLDCNHRLPEMKRLPGLTSWKVMDKGGRIWSSWDEVQEAKSKQTSEGLERLTHDVFAPVDVEGATAIPLHNCMRVYPHLQDTGGFFIAVLEKLSEIRPRPEGEAKSTSTNPTIISVVKEIESRTANGEDTNNLTSLEQLAPSPANAGNGLDPGNEPAVVRQNQPPEEALPKLDGKRALEDDETSEVSSKRIRIEPENSSASHHKEHWPLPPSMAPEASVPSNGSLVDAGSGTKQNSKQPQEEPFKYLDPNHEELQSIYSFYGLSDRFPRDRFMVRNATGQPVKAIYYTSTLTRDILIENEGKGMKFVHCGVKMFVKQDPQGRNICRWRIQSEGLPIIEPWVGEGRVVRLYKRPTLRRLLIEMFPHIARDEWKELGEIGERVRDIAMGCCVLRVETSDDEEGFRAMLLRLYNDDSPLVDNSKDQRLKKRAEESDPPSTVRIEAEEPDEPEAKDTENGVFDADPTLNAEEATTAVAVLEPGVEEEKALIEEDRVLASAQQKADDTKEIAPGVTDEEDVFNKTV